MKVHLHSILLPHSLTPRLTLSCCFTHSLSPASLSLHLPCLAFSLLSLSLPSSLLSFLLSFFLLPFNLPSLFSLFLLSCLLSFFIFPSSSFLYSLYSPLFLYALFHPYFLCCPFCPSLLSFLPPSFTLIRLSLPHSSILTIVEYKTHQKANYKFYSTQKLVCIYVTEFRNSFSMMYN